MNELFKKMLEDKKASQGKEISPVEKQATSSVLQDLMSYLSSMQGDKVKGMKKVTVASNDPKGLVEGLSKAKEMVGSEEKPSEDESHEESMEDPMEESEESPEMEASEEHEEEHSPEEMKKQIAMLKAQLASKGM